QLSVISLLLIDKSPLTLSHIWRKEKEGMNSIAVQGIQDCIEFQHTPSFEKGEQHCCARGGLKMLN
ncbi:MAG: hypothetical protein WB445_13920, partial [Acinetobacter sp.]